MRVTILFLYWDDYFFSQGADGRGSKVEVLPGGDQVGEITDLTFFSKKLARGLRIPPSYLSIGDEQNGSVTFNDGKLGAALIQEYRFNKYCLRLQNLLAPTFDREFKKYLKDTGIEIENDLFEIQFNPPQNFTKYRQIELDAQQMQVYSQIAGNNKLSERFKLKRFLNLTEDEILESEKLWKEENANKLKSKTGITPADNTSQQGDLSSIGVRSMDGNMGDMGGMENINNEMPNENGLEEPGGMMSNEPGNVSSPISGNETGGNNIPSSPTPSPTSNT